LSPIQGEDYAVEPPALAGLESINATQELEV